MHDCIAMKTKFAVKMNSKVYKWCAVPKCKNTSIATPNKVFVYVPNKKIIRDEWLKLARRNPRDVVTNSPLYFCEDHFDLPNDMENYMEYHVMGSVSQVRMRPGCMPKKFICQRDRTTQTSNTTERPDMMNIQECEKKFEEKSIVTEQSSSEEIASGSPVKAARATWRKLRDNHREALKRAKLGQNKLLPAQITTWKYAKAMQFLEPHMKYRITENIDSEVVEEKISNIPEQDVSTSECTNQVRECTPQKRRCVEYQSETSSLQQDGDALESFFLCMLKSTREMPPWMQTQVKKKIFAVIIDAEEQLANESKVDSHENVFSEEQIKRETFSDNSCDYT